MANEVSNNIYEKLKSNVDRLADRLDPNPNDPTKNNLDRITANVGSGGGGGGIMVVTGTYDESTDTATLNNTWQEIYDAVTNGVLPVHRFVDDSIEGETYANIFYLNVISESGEFYRVDFIGLDQADGSTIMTLTFTCSSPNDYPTSVSQG